jgi:thiol:disulfide interchange protein DsbD
MAFPMFATVVWLVWVLGRQVGLDAVAALLGFLVALALASASARRGWAVRHAWAGARWRRGCWPPWAPGLRRRCFAVPADPRATAAGDELAALVT